MRDSLFFCPEKVGKLLKFVKKTAKIPDFDHM